MKKIIALFFCLTLLFAIPGGRAERKTVVKDQFYLGAMKVVNCKNYVSLREAPSKASKQLAKVPPGAIVYSCSNNVKEYAPSPYRKQIAMFIRCEYEGQEGYIMSKYLQKAPEYEPAETRAEHVTMTKDEVIGSGEVILEWQEFNVAVIAAKEYITEDGKEWETIRVGCFIDDEPNWGYTESMVRTDEKPKLRVFMGGTEDEPQVYVYDAGYGLIMLDLMDGTEMWTVYSSTCFLGDAAVVASGENTGILYIAGSEGPDPVAISAEGSVLWKSEINDPDMGAPEAILLKPNEIEVQFESGGYALLEYNGELISIVD